MTFRSRVGLWPQPPGSPFKPTRQCLVTARAGRLSLDLFFGCAPALAAFEPILEIAEGVQNDPTAHLAVRWPIPTAAHFRQRGGRQSQVTCGRISSQVRGTFEIQGISPGKVQAPAASEPTWYGLREARSELISSVARGDTAPSISRLAGVTRAMAPKFRNVLSGWLPHCKNFDVVATPSGTVLCGTSKYFKLVPALSGDGNNPDGCSCPPVTPGARRRREAH